MIFFLWKAFFSFSSLSFAASSVWCVETSRQFYLRFFPPAPFFCFFSLRWKLLTFFFSSLLFASNMRRIPIGAILKISWKCFCLIIFVVDYVDVVSTASSIDSHKSRSIRLYRVTWAKQLLKSIHISYFHRWDFFSFLFFIQARALNWVVARISYADVTPMNAWRTSFFRHSNAEKKEHIVRWIKCTIHLPFSIFFCYFYIKMWHCRKHT